jgi:hypothetical protein
MDKITGDGWTITYTHLNLPRTVLTAWTYYYDAFGQSMFVRHPHPNGPQHGAVRAGMRLV